MIAALRKLWPDLKVYRGALSWVIFLGLLSGLSQGWAPELIKDLVAAWEKGDRKLAFTLPMLIGALWIFAAVTKYFHIYIMKYTADKISVKQRRMLMDKYLSLNLSLFQNFEKGSGGLISRMINDISIIQTGIHRVSDMIREPIRAVGALGYLLYLDWMLTLFILMSLPIVTTVLRRVARSLRKYSRFNQEIMEDLTRTLKESLDGTRVVQSFGIESEMRRKFNTQADEFLANRKKIISREELAGPLSEALTTFFLCAVFVYIGTQVLDKKITIADFVAFMFAMGILQDAVRRIQDGYLKLQQTNIALDRFHEIMDLPASVKEPVAPFPFPGDWQAIEYRNVSFAYKDERVLKNINLKVGRNETVALVGSSGSGKSTLVNLLQRFFDPTEGEILIDGTNIKNFSIADLRKNIALVTQDIFLFNDSIRYNIQMGNIGATIEKIENAAKFANAHNFILQTPQKYETSVGDFGGRMSGGEKQRISIARAILKDSPILVLDEATSALDSESELEVQKGLTHLLQGRTAFIIAHRLSTIAKANRILVLRKGEIVEEGPHSVLLERKGEYFKFHQMQFLN